MITSRWLAPDAGRRGSWTLIEMVVVLAVLAVLGYWLVPRYLSGSRDSQAERTVSAPIERAHGVECLNNLRQIRSAVQIATTTGEAAPQSLSEFSSYGIPESMFVCPVSGQAYRYDPGSGRVGCPLSEHQQY